MTNPFFMSVPTVLPILVLLLSVPKPVNGQIVNIENILAGEPQPGVQAALQIGFTTKQGNSEYRQFDGSGLMRWRIDNHLIQVVIGGSYRTAQDIKVADNAMGHLRYGFMLLPRLRMEALAQIQKDSFVQLRRRILIGAGVRVNLYSRLPATSSEGEPGEQRLDLGLIIMHESEELHNASSEPGWRASFLISTGWSISGTVSLGSQVYIQPLLSDPEDVRVLGDGGLTVRLLGPLSLQLSARIVYDSRPPDGVKTTDFLLRNTLLLSF